MRVLLDANVVLRLIEPAHSHHDFASEAVDLLRGAGHDLVLVPQTLYEFWSVATRPIENNGLGMSAGESAEELKFLKRLFRLLRDERAVYREWEKLVLTLGVRGKKAHDTRLVAAMNRHCVQHLLTFNGRDFVRYSNINILSPHDIAEAPDSL